MRVNQFNEYHRLGSKFLMITMVLYFLFFVSITPFVYGLAEEINIELEMSESLEDIQELSEEFLKACGSDFQYPLKPTTRLEEMNDQFINSYTADIPFPPPKTT
jgi:hypothetical protein